MDDETSWDIVSRIVEWLDSKTDLPPSTVELLRVLKIGEEYGEVAEAVHGVMGSNPRKGVSHTQDDIVRELFDVILTAMVAVVTMRPDAKKAFGAHLSSAADRLLSS
ncbi:MazG-like family protein [Streptomyces sp. UNOC14_S4]|nr:MazG-like family protein [Streptomyces sp. UNOC14_S4]